MKYLITILSIIFFSCNSQNSQEREWGEIMKTINSSPVVPISKLEKRYDIYYDLKTNQPFTGKTYIFTPLEWPNLTLMYNGQDIFSHYPIIHVPPPPPLETKVYESSEFYKSALRQYVYEEGANLLESYEKLNNNYNEKDILYFINKLEDPKSKKHEIHCLNVLHILTGNQSLSSYKEWKNWYRTKYEQKH